MSPLSREWTPEDQRITFRIGVNAAQAAIRAGYSAKTAKVIGAQNLSKLNIRAAIEKAQNKRAERAQLTAGHRCAARRSPPGSRAGFSACF